MSDKVRVLFKVPQSHPKWSKIVRPVDITLEDYVQFRIDEHNGSKDNLAHYISKKYLKGEYISPSDIEMIEVPGNYINTFDLQMQIDQGINPLAKMNQDDSDDEDNDYFTKPRGYEDDDDEDDKDNDDNDDEEEYEDKGSSVRRERTRSSSKSNDKEDIQKALLLIGIGVVIFAVLFIIAFT